MSFYRVILAMLACLIIATPVCASYDDNMQTSSDSKSTQEMSDSQSTNSKVNLNTATVKELIKVKGITPAKARAIVAYRKKHGDFKSIDELSNVKGFKNLKPTKFKQIENQVSVD